MYVLLSKFHVSYVDQIFIYNYSWSLISSLTVVSTKMTMTQVWKDKALTTTVNSNKTDLDLKMMTTSNKVLKMTT